MGGRRRWIVLIFVLVAGAIVVSQLVGGDGRHVTGERVARYVPRASDLAAAYGDPSAVIRQVPPPVNPDHAEAAARSLTMGRAPLPDDRAVISFQRGDTGAETTVALLLYDDPARAGELEDLAGDLLPKAVGLEPRPAALAGADSARTWVGPGYAAYTFRLGGVIGFIGTTDASADRWLEAVAGAIVARLAADPPPTPAAGSPGVVPATR